MRNRAAKTAAVLASSSAVSPAQKKGPGLFEWVANLPRFFNEVRAEARKITWTTRRETWITSVMVGIMVIMAVGFFAVVDLGLSFGVTQILKLASAR